MPNICQRGACGHQNHPRAKFCIECGSTLTTRPVGVIFLWMLGGMIVLLGFIALWAILFGWGM